MLEEKIKSQKSMLSVSKALNKILVRTLVTQTKQVLLKDAYGCVLSQDLSSPMELPQFDNSAVDGYAVHEDTESKDQIQYRLQGELPAGKTARQDLKPGHAMRIFTGAPVPWGTYSVCMQEDAFDVNGTVSFSKLPDKDKNIRMCGEDVRIGDKLLSHGTKLEPQHLALLASVGCGYVPVHEKPKVAILATGSELIPTGRKLKKGKIYDSNTTLLRSCVQKSLAEACVLPTVGDNIAKLKQFLRVGLKKDVLIVSGGVSVGKYDYVKETLKSLGVQKVFWKVAMKPGKPLFFGMKNGTLVFGLPGNPVSAFITFEKFVRPALLKMQNQSIPKSESIHAKLTHDYQNGARYHFVRGLVTYKQGECYVTPLRGQGSHMVGSLGKANALMELEANQSVKKGDVLKVSLLGKVL